MTRRRTVTLIVVLAAAALVAFLWWRRGRDSSAGERTVVSAGPNQGAATRTTPQAIRPRATSPDIRGLAMASVSGAVRDEQAAPIAGAWVCVTVSDESLSQEENREPHCTTTAPDGSYRIDKLYPIEAYASAGAPRFAPGRWRDPETKRQDFELVAGQERKGIDFVLEGGAVEVRGIVKDIGGGGIPGAIVWLSSRDNASDRAISGDDGTFVGWARPGEIWAWARADGYTSGWRSAIAPGETVELLLTPESVIGGVVLEATSKAPVVGARVDLSGDEWEQESTITDAQGRFRFTEVAPGRYKPEAKAPELYGQSSESVLVGVGESRDDLVIEVHAARTLRGRVVIAASGETPEAPCREGSVSIADGAASRSYTAKIKGGEAVFDAVLPGDYAVTVECEEHPGRDEYPEIAVGEAAIPEQRWEVDQGSRLHGRVTDAAGAPVGSASVQVQGVGGRRGRSWYWVRTERDGTYELKGIKDGSYTMSVDSQEHPSLPEPKKVEVAGDTAIDIELPAGGAIDGVVVDQDGKPMGGLEIRAVGEKWSWWSGGSRSRDDGTFHIDGVRPGAYRVTASRDWTPLRRPGSKDDDVQGERVTVGLKQPARVRLVIESASGVIRGRVIDATGAPVTDAFITADRQSEAAGAAKGGARRSSRWGWFRQPSLTDTDGRFVVDELSPGTYTVVARRKGGGEVVTENVALGSDIVMTITPTARLGGRVELAGGGAPLDFTVSIEDETTGVSRSERFYRTGGAWALRELPAGTYDVAARAREGAATELGVTLADGQARTDVRLSLTRFITIRGTVVSFDDGKPVKGMMVYARPVKGGSGGWPSDAKQKYISDDQGRFEVESVPVTRLTIGAWPQDWQGSPWQGGHRYFDASTLSGSTDSVDVGEIRVLPRRLPPMTRGGDLGFTLVENPPDTDPTAVTLVVANIRPDGPAAQTTLAVGDTIVAVDGHSVVGENAWYFRALTEVPQGTVITLEVARGDTISIKAAAPI